MRATILMVGAVALTLLTCTSAQSNFVVPSKVIAVAQVADLSLGNIEEQWNKNATQVTYAWDLTKNCYSETWTVARHNKNKRDKGPGIPMDYQTVTCGGFTVSNLMGRCSNVTSTAVQSTVLSSLYVSLFNVTEGLVNDPFRDTQELLTLWKNPSNQSWMWLNSTTNDIVYIQTVRADIKKTLVYYFPLGTQTETGVSSYNFQVFSCAKP